MILKDFIMLGTTVPEPTKKDKRIFVCSAGVSLELGQLIRVYPLSRLNPPKRWSINHIELERPERNKDSRESSWKIKGDRSEEAHPLINNKFKQVGIAGDYEKQAICERFLMPSIKNANEQKMSLGIIKPVNPILEFKRTPNPEWSPQQSLFSEGNKCESGSKRFPLIPYICFDDEHGHHELSLRDWGSFELMRKNPDTYNRYEYGLSNALHLEESPYLLVGNMSNIRTSWLVISVFPASITCEQQQLFK